MKTLIGLALAANIYGADFVVGNEYSCGFEGSRPFMTLSVTSKGMVFANESMLFQQPDNNRLYIGVGAGNSKQMMVFLHEDGDLTIGGENIKMATLKCKLEVDTKK